MTFYKKSVLKISALTSAIILASFNTQAALYDRGNGMIYDSALNITWLQDANYAKTSGYSDNGWLNWMTAQSWVDNLVYAGFSDWRLPSANPVGNLSMSYDGSTDVGFNNTRSELRHLFAELGNQSSLNSIGEYQGGAGWANVTFIDPDTQQSVSFLNISQYGQYWSDKVCCGYDVFYLWLALVDKISIMVIAKPIFMVGQFVMVM